MTTVRWDRTYLFTLVGVVVLLLCCFPLAIKLDAHTDRQKPMYHDRETMAWLQYKQIASGGSVVSVSPTSDKVSVGDQSFHPSHGVMVEAKPDGDGYCVRASNDHGDRTSWYCDAGSTDPRS